MFVCTRKKSPNFLISRIFSATPGDFSAPGSTALNDASSAPCKVPTDEAGLLWDGVCFAFLLVQKRLFTSYYFHHLIVEILAQQQLASRGAEMIHEIQMKGVQVREENYDASCIIDAVH